jgi:hypothetical protein
MAQGARNTAPDVPHFVNAFKTLLVNNFMGTHSPGANCEDDCTAGVLDNLRHFLIRRGMADIRSLDAPMAKSH